LRAPEQPGELLAGRLDHGLILLTPARR